jgi:tetratricopeptide (TPR) repeat protein
MINFNNFVDKAFEAYDLQSNFLFQPALTLFLELHNFEPENKKFILSIANCYYNLKDYTNSQIYTDKVLSTEPENADALMFKAYIADETGHPEEFRELMHKIIDLKKANYEIYVQLAQHYFDRGEYYGALGLFTTAIKKEDAPSFSISLNIANCYGNLGAHGIAEEIYKILETFYKDNESLMYNEAVNYFDMGNENQGNKLCIKIIRNSKSKEMKSRANKLFEDNNNLIS